MTLLCVSVRNAKQMDMRPRWLKR